MNKMCKWNMNKIWIKYEWNMNEKYEWEIWIKYGWNMNNIWIKYE